MTTLKVLHSYSNPTPSPLPPEWSAMKSLETLMLHECQITALSADWSGMTALKTL